MTIPRIRQPRDSSFDTHDGPLTQTDLDERGFDLAERVDSVLPRRGRHFRQEDSPFFAAGPDVDGPEVLYPLIFTIRP